MIFGLKRRLAKIRRAVADPDQPGHCAMWAELRVIEVLWPPPKVVVVVHFSGGKEAELSRERSVLRAMVKAERNLHEQRMKAIKPPTLVDVTPFLYRSHAEDAAYYGVSEKDNSAQGDA